MRVATEKTLFHVPASGLPAGHSLGEGDIHVPHEWVREEGSEWSYLSVSQLFSWRRVKEPVFGQEA